MLQTTALLTIFVLKKALKTKTKNIRTKQKLKMIGVQAEVPLIATNLYQATFKKILENKKWPKWKIIWVDICLIFTFKKNAKKKHFLGKKVALFRSRKTTKNYRIEWS